MNIDPSFFAARSLARHLESLSFFGQSIGSPVGDQFRMSVMSGETNPVTCLNPTWPAWGL